MNKRLIFQQTAVHVLKLVNEKFVYFPRIGDFTDESWEMLCKVAHGGRTTGVDFMEIGFTGSIPVWMRLIAKDEKFISRITLPSSDDSVELDCTQVLHLSHLLRLVHELGAGMEGYANNMVRFHP